MVATGLTTQPLQPHLVPCVRDHTGQLSRTGGKEEMLRERPTPSVEPGCLLYAVLIRIPENALDEGGDGPVLQGHLL